MPSTNKTTNLQLSQFTQNDMPKWLQDYNGDMAKIDAAVAVKLSISDILNKVYPVGAIYESTSSISPTTFINGSIWESFGGGKFLLGANSSYPAGGFGGASNVTLTIAQMPSHNHSYETVISGNNINLGDGGTINFQGTYSNQLISGNRGGNQSHENMPPYIVVYRWRRTA
jgi:hypothetical protein